MVAAASRTVRASGRPSGRPAAASARRARLRATPTVPAASSRRQSRFTGRAMVLVLVRLGADDLLRVVAQGVLPAAQPDPAAARPDRRPARASINRLESEKAALERPGVRPGAGARPLRLPDARPDVVRRGRRGRQAARRRSRRCQTRARTPRSRRPPGGPPSGGRSSWPATRRTRRATDKPLKYLGGNAPVTPPVDRGRPGGRRGRSWADLRAAPTPSVTAARAACPTWS